MKMIDSYFSGCSTIFTGDPEEVLKHESRIPRTGCRFGMKLHRTKWLRLVADPFIRTIVQVYEPRLPILGQPFHVHSVAMVLAGQIGSLGGEIHNRLVMRTVAVFHL